MMDIHKTFAISSFVIDTSANRDLHTWNNEFHGITFYFLVNLRLPDRYLVYFYTKK